MLHEDDRVYFMARNDGLVKIGHSRSPESRLRSLRKPGDGLTLLVALPGGQFAERRFHRRYASLRSAGEWFRCEGPLAKFVARLRAPATVARVLRRSADIVRIRRIQRLRESIVFREGHIVQLAADVERQRACLAKDIAELAEMLATGAA